MAIPSWAALDASNIEPLATATTINERGAPAINPIIQQQSRQEGRPASSNSREQRPRRRERQQREEEEEAEREAEARPGRGSIAASCSEADHFYDRLGQHYSDYLLSSERRPTLGSDADYDGNELSPRCCRQPQRRQHGKRRRRREFLTELKQSNSSEQTRHASRCRASLDCSCWRRRRRGAQVQGCRPGAVAGAAVATTERPSSGRPEEGRRGVPPLTTVIETTATASNRLADCSAGARGDAHSQRATQRQRRQQIAPRNQPMNSPLSCDSLRATADRARRVRDGDGGEPPLSNKSRPAPVKGRRRASLLGWALVCLLALFASLELRGPVQQQFGRAFITPASAASAIGAPGTNTTSATLATDEFSRAVLATMSTQSSLAVASGEQNATRPPVAMALRPTQDADLDAGSVADADERPDLAVAPAAHESLQEAERTDQRHNQLALGEHLGRQNYTGSAPNPAHSHQAVARASNNRLDDYVNNVMDFVRIFAMVAIMIGDICGNSLVILSVVRHSKLRVTTNWFVVSLACADILVAVFAMTFNASVQITGRWIFPRWMCDFWNSCDVLASTASILHLCCISIDRYYAIMRPLDYPMKITTRRVCYALAVVWISSALLSYIPIFTGIYTTPEHSIWQQANPDQCEFVVNRVYAIVSSSISFWIPCCIMVFTYYRIYEEATRQEKFIYEAQNRLPAPQLNHHHHQSQNSRAKQQRSKSMAVTSLTATNRDKSGAGSGDQANKIKQLGQRAIYELKPDDSTSAAAAAAAANSSLLPNSNSATANTPPEQQPLTGSAIDLNNNNNNNKNNNNNNSGGGAQRKTPSALPTKLSKQQQQDDQDERDSNSGQSTPTKRSISKMKREHKAAKTLGIIMGVFILCWLPFFSWYTPVHICGHMCDGMVPHNVVTLLFWIGYFNSTLNPIIYAYFNHEFRDAFKKTLQWIFCCCRDLKCLRVNRPNDNQHYNCTYRSTQEIGLVTNG